MAVDMRQLVNMDTIQIEITNACPNRCANCTRFVAHAKQYFMTFEQFKCAVNSMVDYPNMTGIMGGEPLLHPEFEKFCNYALSKIKREQLGLWTCLPFGFERYRAVICETFGNIFLNDHTRGDIYHHPFLVAINEVVHDVSVRNKMIDCCFFQDAWSASINPNGAFFCEIAASLSTLFGGAGWEVMPKWWLEADFSDQINKYCCRCGGALSLNRRSSLEQIDDVSPGNKKILGDSKRFVVHNLKVSDTMQKLASYKDPVYRDEIAARYGMRLSINSKMFNEPHLGLSLFQRIKGN